MSAGDAKQFRVLKRASICVKYKPALTQSYLHVNIVLFWKDSE